MRSGDFYTNQLKNHLGKQLGRRLVSLKEVCSALEILECPCSPGHAMKLIKKAGIPIYKASEHGVTLWVYKKTRSAEPIFFEEDEILRLVKKCSDTYGYVGTEIASFADINRKIEAATTIKNIGKRVRRKRVPDEESPQYPSDYSKSHERR